MTLFIWLVARNTRHSDRRERYVEADRAEDLVINDTRAASSIDSITVNITIDEPTGFFPGDAVGGPDLDLHT